MSAVSEAAELKAALRDAVVKGELDEARRLFTEVVLPSGAPTEAKTRLRETLSRAGVQDLPPIPIEAAAAQDESVAATAAPDSATDPQGLKAALRAAVIRGQFDDARRIYEAGVLPSAAPAEVKARLYDTLVKAGVEGLSLPPAPESAEETSPAEPVAAPAAPSPPPVAKETRAGAEPEPEIAQAEPGMTQEESAQLKRTLRQAIIRGRFDEARRIYIETVLPSDAPARTKAKLRNNLTAAGVRDLPPVPGEGDAEAGGSESLVRLAMVDAQKGDAEGALERLDDAAKTASLSKQERALRSQLLLRLGRQAEAFEESKKLVEQFPERADFAAGLIRATFACGKFRLGVQLVAKAMTKWPEAGQFIQLVHRLPLPSKVFAQLFEVAQKNRREHKLPAYSQYMFALLALRAWEVREALEALDQAPGIEHAAVLRQALDAYEPDEWRRRCRLEEDAAKAYEQVLRADAQATLVYFPGAFNNFAQLPLGYLDALISELPINVIYLRDRRSRGFMQGAPGLAETMEDTAVWLYGKKMLLDAPRTYTLGLSLGGFGALRYGALMRADGAFTFGGATLLHGAQQPEEGGSVFSSWRFDAYPESERDAEPNVRSSPEMRVIQVVGSENFEDMRQAARIKSLPNVETIEVEEVADHVGLVHRLIDRKEFLPLLREHMGLS